MYSMVLMMALATGPDAAAFGGRGHGCSGYSCSGYSCSGYSYGCSGYSSGCSGHSWGHGHSYGCSGVSYGCSGVSYGCSGYSSGCSGYSYGCSGYSSCHGGRGGLFGKHRHGGCHGCSGYSYGCSGYSTGCSGYSTGWGCSGGAIYSAPVATPPAAMPAPEKKAASLKSATIVVKLPADATLSVDGRATTSTTGERRFTTPELTEGTTYYYTLTAVVGTGSDAKTDIKQVLVRAGETSSVTLEPAAAVVLK